MARPRVGEHPPGPMAQDRGSQTPRTGSPPPAHVGHGPEAALVARATVWRALDALTPRRRAVVVLHELEGLTVSAIASLLGVSAITVRWHLSMGRRDLIRTLAPQMGDANENR